MRRAFWLVWLVFVAWFGAAACGLNTQPTSVGSGADAGASGGTGGGAGAGGGVNNCFPTPDQKFCGGDLCPPKTDPAHGCAGSSCAACTIENATAVCAADGTCTEGTCNTGFTDCDGDPKNGCEINTDSDPTNCGSCGNNCFNDKSATNWVCQSGQCVVSNCAPGKGDCDGNSANACETDLNTDPKNCKFCGNDCSTTVLHATPTCTGGVCGFSKCAAGWADCDGDPTNGCEQDIATDPLHCGGCDSATYACSTANGLPACQGGKCTIGCASGFGNCDGNIKNGCETNLTNNKDHCGSCTNKCSANNDTPTCSGGKCQIACKGGYGNCDGNINNGCEASFSSASTCGSCSKDCSTLVAHATAACGGGNCTFSGNCAAGWGDCDGNKANGCEASLTTTTRCGACGTNCSTNVKNATAICSSGSCSYSGSCAAGWADCDGNKANGCEKPVGSDVNNCGSCGYKCADHLLHASGPTCSGGKCGYSSCNNNWDNCDNDPTNGCEADLTATTSCGSCSNDCTQTVLHVGSVTCSGGSCGYSGGCSPGYDDCDGNADNGCETPLHTNSDCSGCGDTCTGSKTCQNWGGNWGCHN